MVDVARLTPVDLRQVWPREAADFTPWLADNLQALGEVLGMDLQLQQREAGVGAFSLDLLVLEVNTNRVVVIENQLEQTNHDHLGKLLTYASGQNADVVIWIAKELREEHRQALDWLNQRTDQRTDFYGVVVGAVRIDSSRPAYRFEVEARPNQTGKAERLRSQANSAVSERREAYRAFFQELMDGLRERHRFTNARTAQLQSWYNFASGFRGITYAASFARDGRARAELYISTTDANRNKRLFDLLLQRREQIEESVGSRLEWERLDHAVASRVAAYRPGSIDSDEATLREVREWFTAMLLKIRAAFEPALREVLRRADLDDESRLSEHEVPEDAGLAIDG